MKYMVATFLVALFPVSLAAQDAKKPSEVRIALVGTAPGAAFNSLIDLAQVRISNQPGIELLERQGIARVLQEQRLSLAGLVDANTAVAAGKLLAVDLFALLEMDPAGKEALGLIVYDTGTGIKWHDQMLTAGSLDKQVDTVAAAVAGVVKKRSTNARALRTICILGTRNADLPRSQDHVAPTVAWLLERTLVASPSLAVLERKRLDWVTKEKTLASAAAHKDLLASLVTVEVEISRADKGMRATAHLSDHQGKELGKVRAESAAAKAEELANGLLAGIVRTLKAAPAATTPDRARESRRFFQEGQLLASHKHWQPAVQALEAAFALDPTNTKIPVDLGKALLYWGHETLSPQPHLKIPPITGLPLKPEEVKQALAAGLRSLELRLEYLRQTPRTLAGLSAYDSVFRESNFKLAPFKLGFVQKDAIDDEGRDLRQELFAAFVRNAKAELAHWVEAVAKEGPSQAPGAGRVSRVSSLFLEARSSRYFSDQELETLGLEWMQDWSKAILVPGLRLYPYDVNKVFEDPFDRSPRFVPLYEVLAKHGDPLVQFWGRYLLLSVRRHQGQLTGVEADLAYQQLKQSALQAIEKYRPPAQPLTSVHEDFRHACYMFLFMTTKYWTFSDAQARFDQRFALCDFMLRRKELVLHPFTETLQRDPAAKDGNDRQRWYLIQQAQDLLAAGTPGLCDSPAFLGNALANFQKAILREHPELAERPKTSTAQVPWKSARLLVRPDDLPGLKQMGRPLVQGDHILLPICRSLYPQKRETWVDVLHVSMNGERAKAGSWKKRAQWKVPDPGPGKPQPYPAEVRCTCAGDGRYFIGTRYGILACDDDGRVQLLSQDSDLPGRPNLLAFHQGRLFAYLEGGYFIALDAGTGKFETLASSRRRERLSPFDDAEEFRMVALHLDPQRERLLFLLYQRPNTPLFYPREVIPAKDTTNGLWEYHLKTKKFTRHLELYFDVLNTGSTVQPDHWLLSHVGPDNVLDFDLKTNQAAILLGRSALGPDLHRPATPRQQPSFPFYQSYWKHESRLWAVSLRSLGSISLKDGRLEEYSGFTPETPVGFSGWHGLERIDSHRLLMQNTSGLWLLEMEKQPP